MFCLFAGLSAGSTGKDACHILFSFIHNEFGRFESAFLGLIISQPARTIASSIGLYADSCVVVVTTARKQKQSRTYTGVACYFCSFGNVWVHIMIYFGWTLLPMCTLEWWRVLLRSMCAKPTRLSFDKEQEISWQSDTGKCEVDVAKGFSISALSLLTIKGQREAIAVTSESPQLDHFLVWQYPAV